MEPSAARPSPRTPEDDTSATDGPSEGTQPTDARETVDRLEEEVGSTNVEGGGDPGRQDYVADVPGSGEPPD